MDTPTKASFEQKRALSIAEFCEIYNVSRSKTFRLLAAGTLTRLKLGTKTLIRVDEAETWFRSLEEAA